MTTNYPTSLDTFPVHADNSFERIAAAHVNNIQDAVLALETVLGTTPPLPGSNAWLSFYGATPAAMLFGAITVNASGAPTAGTVTWPDGKTGAYAGTANGTYPQYIDSYTVTWVNGATTKTVTQASVTRNPAGYVTNRPALTIA